MRKLKHYFIPHKGNEHRPHFLRDASLGVLLSLTLILFLSSLSYGIVVLKTNLLSSIFPSLLVDLTNESRLAINDIPLAVNPLLEKAAEFKAGDMVTKEYFAHISPEGKTPWYWFDLAGYKYLYAGENLAVNFSDSNDVLQAWMDSPTHRANILNNHFTEIGISVSKGVYKGRNTLFVVQMFGSPLTDLPKEEKIVAPLSVAPQKITTIAPLLKAEVSEQKSSNVLGENDTAKPEVTFVSIKNSAATLGASTVALSGAVRVSGTAYNLPWYKVVVLYTPSLLTNSYVVLAILIFLAILSLVIEMKVHHPRGIFFGILLLAFVLILLYVSKVFLFPQILIV
jgi:Cysteine-rich secretory protein family